MELTRIGYHHFIFQTIDEFLEKREGANIRDLDELHAYWKAHPWENLLDLEVTTYLRKDGRQEHCIQMEVAMDPFFRPKNFFRFAEN